MKRFYPKFRISLMTFALGLASVFMFQGSLYSEEIYVDLPEVKSDSPIIVIPVESKDALLYEPGWCYIYTEKPIEKVNKQKSKVSVVR